MAKICKADLTPIVPGESPFSEHVSVLTSLSLGRCAGIKLRPCLLCPKEVHLILFKAALEVESKNGKSFRQLFPSINTWPASRWQGPQKRTRLHGRQPDPAVPIASQKRLVQSHNDNIASVQWSSDETKEIDQAQDWRQRQRIQKRLLHNRTAQEHGKHFILPFDADTPAKCRDCLKEAKKTSGISRFLTEPCGGSVDIGVNRDPHASRDSVKLKTQRYG